MKTKWAKPAKLSALLKKHHPSAEKGDLPSASASEDPVTVLLHSWLLWEASSEQAETAMAKLMESRVDVNEIRVSLPHELAPTVGKRYPRLEERLLGIKKSLHSIYLRRHEISLNYVREKGKRDAKAEIESLDGINPFVSARVLRLSFGVHAMPADEQLSLLLHELGVINEPVEHEVLATWLASEVKVDDGHRAIAALQAAVDAAWLDGTMIKLARKRRPPKPFKPEVVVVETEEEPSKEAVEPVKKPAVEKAATKAPAKKPAVTKAPAKKPAVAKAPAKKPAVAKAPTKKPVAKKASAKKTVAKKASAKKTVAKKAPTKKAVAKKVPTKKAATKKSVAKKSTTGKSPAKKVAKKTAKRKTSRPVSVARKRVD
ncbi:MAG: histone H1-like repetitive region-containing protein [Phycisphaerales bacterium]|nr:histone H1-like repetitive region-containing protein [Phycisphaerales bacterium]